MSLRKIQLAAVRCLLAVESGRNLQVALAEERNHLENWTASEQAALMDIAYGVQRFSGSLKFFLHHLLDKPLSNKKIDALLRVALYQLYDRRNAEHAVVNEAVSGSLKIAQGRFKSLVNAVLRQFLRERDRLQQSLSNDLEAFFNLPSWWISRLQKDYPQNAEEIMRCAMQHPPLTLRVNRRLSNAGDYQKILHNNGLEGEIMDDYAIMLKQAVPVTHLPFFFDGMVSVQDFGAQMAASLLNVQNGENVLDACAAPGGKTGHLLEWADCQVTAVDIDENRLQRVKENLNRLHFSADLRLANAGNISEWKNQPIFDAILADVPCTASGTIRRNPDIKWLRRPDDAMKTAQQQQPLLDALWSYLKPNGRMLLATCSIFHEENSDQKNAFLARHQDAICTTEKILLPNPQHDGFYYALFEKKNPS